MNAAYEYGQKLAAEPWSPLRTGLTHGSLAALPGAAIGGGIGYFTSPADATDRDRRVRAAYGAGIGGAITGLPAGSLSGAAQRLHSAEYDQAKAYIAGLNGSESGFAKALGDYHRAALPNYSATWLGNKGLREVLGLA
jgi:hypothetical protein